jgi:ABC-2 type transport system permease protein
VNTAFLRDALWAEWTKLRTGAACWWLLAAVALVTPAVGAIAVAASRYTAGAPGEDTTRLSLIGIAASQVAVVSLAALAVADEYPSGMIRTTLAAIPPRGVVLAAKATLVCALTMTAGALGVLGAFGLGRVLLPLEGFTPAHGYPLLSLGAAPTLRAAAGSILYLGLVAVLGLGAACAARNSAAAVGGVLGLLYVFPALAVLVTDPRWQLLLEQIGPMSAGLAILATTGLPAPPMSPWAGLGVLACWAATALAIGGLLLWRRDA